jgi:hypothetical protein
MLIAAVVAAGSSALAGLGAYAAAGAPGAQGPFRPTTDSKKACPAGTSVFSVSQSITGMPDVGLLGNPWAVDSFTRTISIIRTAPNTYCGSYRDSGTYTSSWGLSPGATGTLFSTFTGNFVGSVRTTVFTGKLRSNMPTSGTIGKITCNESYCSGTLDWTSVMFESTSGYDVAWWSYSYAGGLHGNWRNQADLSLGDIFG